MKKTLLTLAALIILSVGFFQEEAKASDAYLSGSSEISRTSGWWYYQVNGSVSENTGMTDLPLSGVEVFVSEYGSYSNGFTNANGNFSITHYSGSGSITVYVGSFQNGFFLSCSPSTIQYGTDTDPEPESTVTFNNANFSCVKIQ